VTPLPAALATQGQQQALTVWRLERAAHAASWAQGIGAERVGGRWSPKGRPVIYTSLDPATTILEVAVHAGFEVLDAVPYRMLELAILTPAQVHIVQPEAVPNPNWLRPGAVSAGMQKFGADLLDQHPFVLIPSVVSPHSWNLIIDVASAKAHINCVRDEAFGLDGRLNRVL
jgi:RES domain-containing protein